jgi:hypothetical protein
LNFYIKADNIGVQENKQRLGATSIDPVCIEKSEEDKVEEHHFEEAQAMQKDTREEKVVAQEEQLFKKYS